MRRTETKEMGGRSCCYQLSAVSRPVSNKHIAYKEASKEASLTEHYINHFYN